MTICHRCSAWSSVFLLRVDLTLRVVARAQTQFDYERFESEVVHPEDKPFVHRLLASQMFHSFVQGQRSRSMKPSGLC